MAQVRKYSKGNAITKAAEGEPIIFKWDGYGDYNVADIEKTYARNINNYINSLDLDEEDKKKVRDESFRLLQGMKSGLLTSRDASGKWANVPVGYESTGINEQKRKFLRGKQYIKDDDFYRNNAYRVLDKALQDTNIYTAPKAQPSKFDTKFENYLTKYYFRDLPFNKALWDFNTARTNISARLADWRKEVEASDLDDKTKADLLNRIDVGIAGIQSATTDDDFAALARVGFDARKWIDPDYITETSTNSTSAEQPLTEEQKKQKEYVDAYKARLENITNTGKSNYSTWKYDPNQEVPVYANLSPQELANRIDWSKLNADNMTNKDLLGLFHSYITSPFIRKGLENSGYYENNWYYLPNTQDVANSLITRFNPSTYTFERVPFTSFKTGEDYLKMQLAKELGIVNPWDTTLPQGYKEGGVIKAQGGLSLDYINKAQELYNKDTNNSKSKSRSNVESKPKSHVIGSEEELSDADRARIASIAADAIAGVSAFVPGYGTAVSAVAGLGSTGANAYADYKERGLGTAALNFIPNLALDVVGLIPGAGIGAKAAKIVKALKSAPKLFNIVGAALAANQAGEVYSKMQRGEELSLQDFQQLSSALAGIARIPGGQFVKGRAVNKGLLKEVYPLNINGQKYDLDENTYKSLLSASTKEAQENILKRAGYDIKLDDKITSTLGKNIRKVWNPTNPEYRLTEKGKDYGGFLGLKRMGININLDATERKKYNAISSIPKANVPKTKTKVSKSNSTKSDNVKPNNPKKQLALPASSGETFSSPIVTPYKSKNNDITDHNKFYNQRNPAFDYTESSMSSRFRNPTSTSISYTPSNSSINAPTVSWKIAESNYRAVQKLLRDRQANSLRNIENKELNRLVNDENLAKHQARVKQSEAKKKQEYVNWWMEQLQRQVNPVILGSPKKASSKSKRTRGNKGYVNRHLLGGILKAQQGNVLKYQNPSGSIRDVNSTANWTKQIYGTDPFFNWLKSFNTSNYQDFNNYQKGWNTNYLASKYNPTGTNKSGNVAYSQNVWNSQGIFNKQANGVNQIIEGLAKDGTITRRGNSGDNATRNFQDGYFGGQEYLRHGGMESMLTPEQVAQINKYVNANGLEYYFDPTTKMGHLRPLQNTTLDTSGLDQEVADVNKNIPSPTDVSKSNLSGSPAGAEKPAPTTPKQLDWGNLLGTGRLIGTIATNNAIARGLKNSLSPLLLDPLQLRRQVVGDLATRNYMERLGAEANRLGARPITSDANLQLAQQLEYNNRANDYRTRGWLADKQAIDKTTAEAQKVADFNAEQRNTVANRNRAAMLGIRQAKANIEAQRKSANWQQAIAPWLMNMEMKFAENKKLNDQLNYQENQYTLGSQYDIAARQAQDKLNVAKANYLAIDGNNEAGWLTSPEYTAARNTYEQDLANATNTYQTGMLNARRKSLRYNPFLFTYKSGGRLSYKEKALLERAKDFNKSLLEDRKTFHKIIMESQKENNKLITSLSGLTKELIIKSMTYAH